MQPQAYIEMAQHESSHWWYVGRRTVLANLIGGLDLPREARILEIGSGTGGNLELLAGFGTVTAWEPNPEARSMSTAKNADLISSGKLVQASDVPDGSFDLICLLDVLEHLENPVAMLSALKDQLLPGGRILATVPAYQWMWSNHDELHDHRRRYLARTLRQQLESADLVSLRLGYFNTHLFPLAVAVRALEKLAGLGRRRAGKPSVGMKIPAKPINAMLTKIFESEANVIARRGYPFGLSLFSISFRESDQS